jgi:hypothetical protein
VQDVVGNDSGDTHSPRHQSLERIAIRLATAGPDVHGDIRIEQEDRESSSSLKTSAIASSAPCQSLPE